MHDPCTQVYDLRSLWHWDADGYFIIRIPFLFDKDRHRDCIRYIRLFHPFLKKEKKNVYFPPILTVWHRDPEKDGSDDSCGWFPRLRHFDKGVCKKIESTFSFQWEHGVPTGWFNSEGFPNYSTISIGLGMFRIAANHIFGHWSRGADKFLRDNLHKILSFSENSCDSLYSMINQSYGQEEKEERIANAANVVYCWIMREIRPWYKHPRYHFWHYELQWHPLQHIRRYLFSKCIVCGKGFGWNADVVSCVWDSPKKRWFEFFRSEQHLRHIECGASNYVGESNHNAL